MMGTVHQTGFIQHCKEHGCVFRMQEFVVDDPNLGHPELLMTAYLCWHTALMHPERLQTYEAEQDEVMAWSRAIFVAFNIDPDDPMAPTTVLA